jgi:hypothetical protein
MEPAMTVPRILAALAVLALTASSASALSLEEPGGPLPGMRAAPAGVTSWNLLGKASVLYGEGNDAEQVTTIVPPEVEALDGSEVKLMGFMFPVEAELPMKRFLLVEYPSDCAFCLAAGTEPSRIVEAHSPEGLDYLDGQVVLRGRLEIVRGDADGLVYRLRNTRLED